MWGEDKKIFWKLFVLKEPLPAEEDLDQYEDKLLQHDLQIIIKTMMAALRDSRDSTSVTPLAVQISGAKHAGTMGSVDFISLFNMRSKTCCFIQIGDLEAFGTFPAWL